MKTKFIYDDVVEILPNQGVVDRIGEQAWVVGIFEKKPDGQYFKSFPEGVIYSVEFEDGSSTEVHENNLELFQKSI